MVTVTYSTEQKVELCLPGAVPFAHTHAREMQKVKTYETEREIEKYS